jgi:predicted nucleic acid-binding protein
MSVETFLDTNVFLYHLDDSDLRKHDIAARLIREALDTGNACTSYQVVQECLKKVPGSNCFSVLDAFLTKHPLQNRDGHHQF